ncbi:MAG: hypothetical protein GY835_19940 [bacterium]|nr:hypothetical protein [bacterium]
MDIVKPSISGGRNLASLYGQKPETGGADQARLSQGECQAKQSGPTGTAAAPVLQISAEALDKVERQEALQVAKEIYAELPDSRQDVITLVKSRIASGFYDNTDVKDVLAERLTAVLRKA